MGEMTLGGKYHHSLVGYVRELSTCPMVLPMLRGNVSFDGALKREEAWLLEWERVGELSSREAMMRTKT